MTNHFVVDYKCPLSDKYVVDILSMVYESGRITASDLRKICNNYNTIRNTADRLVSLGLMVTYTEKGARVRIIYEPTQKGVIIGRMLSESRSVLYGDGPMDGNDRRIEGGTDIPLYVGM